MTIFRKYEVGKQNFNVFNVKPTNIEDLKGLTLTCELWQSVLCDTHYTLRCMIEAPASRSIFTGNIASVSDIKFSIDGRRILLWKI